MEAGKKKRFKLCRQNFFCQRLKLVPSPKVSTVCLLCMKVMTLLSFLRQPSLRQAREWAEVLVEPRWVEPNHLRFRLRCGPAPTGSGPAVLNLHHRSNFTSSPRAAARRPSPLQPPSDYLSVGHIFQLPFDNSIATFRVLFSPFTTRPSHLHPAPRTEAPRP
jgi:hypothetical protein